MPVVTADGTVVGHWTAGVYLLRHRDNGRIYVGTSINIEVRFRQHVGALRYSRHTNVFLQEDWHGDGTYLLDILELLPHMASRVVCEAREQEYIRRLQPYYNSRVPYGEPDSWGVARWVSPRR